MTLPVLDDLPLLPRDADGPVFREPWEASAFALAVSLHARGVFTWPHWAAALAEELARARDAGRDRRVVVGMMRAGHCSSAMPGRHNTRCPAHIKPRARRLAWPARPTMRWSWTPMPTVAQALATSRVMSMSARDGVVSPDGWL